MNVPKFALAGDKIQPTRSGSQANGPGPAGVFRYRGDQYVMILITPHQWPQVVRAMARPELGEDPRFTGARARQANRVELQKIIENWLAGFPPRDDAIAALDKERGPCAPVVTGNEGVGHPHLNRCKAVRWGDDRNLGPGAVPAGAG